ncbi:hypothetical protein [Clostridium oryzae]|uniref:Uncharacterized protein n=1 Tax=Clostridium oryzae TaxID=1450648 RepID=A0A1V4IVX0_9CLOT|nr:hypothetical protein [Clostridium oryzae]OPJ63934.1 hypothetical protein CLORY_08060 [Clostridium oryzae]
MSYTNSYGKHITNSNMDDVNAVLTHIIREEKEYYGKILTLLRKYDPEEYSGYKEHKGDKQTPKSPMQAYTPNFNERQN